MTPQELLAEITAGPLAAELAPLVAAGNAAGVLAALARADRPATRPVPIVEVSGYCATRGITGTLKTALDDPALPPAVRGVCHATLTLIQDDYRLTTLDVTDPAFGAVTGGLIAAGLITAGQQAELADLGSAARSRAAELGWSVGRADVDAALALGEQS